MTTQMTDSGREVRDKIWDFMDDIGIGMYEYQKLDAEEQELDPEDGGGAYDELVSMIDKIVLENFGPDGKPHDQDSAYAAIISLAREHFEIEEDQSEVLNLLLVHLG